MKNSEPPPSVKPGFEDHVSNSDEGSDWHLVDLSPSGGVSDMPISLQPCEQTSEAQLIADPDEPGTEIPSSPESEKLADSVLCQPFSLSDNLAVQASTSQSGQLPNVPVDDEDDDHSSAARDEIQSVMSLSRLSQEGSLEGFADELDRLHDFSAEGPEDLHGAGRWMESLWSSLKDFKDDACTELADLKQLLSQCINFVCGKASAAMCNAKDMLQQLQMSLTKTVYKLRQSKSTWALLSFGALAVLACGALVLQYLSNKRLSTQLRQRDKELARLVVKILNLQDALQSGRAVPILRQTSLPTFAVTSMM